MYDYSKQLGKFHDEKVRLTKEQQADMRKRRETNLDRIKSGLSALKKPEHVQTINQGGYAQKTMTQPPESDQESRYDIDLGIVFNDDVSASPRTTRNWVRDAIAEKSSNMKNDPETKKKCVRVIYADGYQCDFPVFRRSLNGTSWLYELSDGDEWTESDPQAMNIWIDERVSQLSPEDIGSYQLRRIIRFGKFFVKTHAKRINLKLPAGLVNTALFIEAYTPHLKRDDKAFRETLRNISNRSKNTPVYANGVQVSDAKDVDRIERLISQAKDAVEQLDKLDQITSDAEAQKIWNNVFKHSFFSDEDKKPSTVNKTVSSAGTAAVASPFVASKAAAELTAEEKARRMESAVRSRSDSGGGGKPWSN
ncbi:MAG: hypothetical protein KTR23_04355 [Rhodospirillales bacterium]|nr:hypothetical protein [Rhodospirillales bacterium]